MCGASRAAAAEADAVGTSARSGSATSSSTSSSSSSSTVTSRLKRNPTASSLMPFIMAANMSKPSRWYSTSGSRWEYARR